MICRDFENLVLALARDSLLDAAKREQGLVHAENCKRCATRLAEERALLTDVRSVVAELAGEEPSERVDAALLAAFRAQMATTASPAFVLLPKRTRRWSNWRLAACAAGILLLISVMVIFWKSAGSLKPRHEEQAVLPTPLSTPGPPVGPQKRAEPPVIRDRLVIQQSANRRNRVRPQAFSDDSAESAEVEVVTQFFPLREGEDLTALESLQLVRVELPGSALSEVGLPVSLETANAPVEADVLLGQDGMARAIRFVR
jgi:hypothetical protein